MDNAIGTIAAAALDMSEATAGYWSRATVVAGEDDPAALNAMRARCAANLARAMRWVLLCKAGDYDAALREMTATGHVQFDDAGRPSSIVLFDEDREMFRDRARHQLSAAGRA